MGKRRRRSSGNWWTGSTGGVSHWLLVALVGILVIGTGGLTVAALGKQSAPAAAPVPVQTEFSFGSERPTATRVAVVGDSNTEVNSPDFAAGRIGDASWVAQLVGQGYAFAGGWADGGSTSAEQAAALAPVEADVLLVMTGTNDLGRGLSFEQSTANITEITTKVTAPRVVLLAIPPHDKDLSGDAVEYNANLASLASERGWEYFDGMSSIRTPDGRFVEGTASDGVHLVPDAQREFGQAVRDYLGA